MIVVKTDFTIAVFIGFLIPLSNLGMHIVCHKTNLNLFVAFVWKKFRFSENTLGYTKI